MRGWEGYVRQVRVSMECVCVWIVLGVSPKTNIDNPSHQPQSFLLVVTIHHAVRIRARVKVRLNSRAMKGGWGIASEISVWTHTHTHKPEKMKPKNGQTQTKHYSS